MPPVVLLSTPVNTQVLDTTHEGVRTLSIYEHLALQDYQVLQETIRREAPNFHVLNTLATHDVTKFQRVADTLLHGRDPEIASEILWESDWLQRALYSWQARCGLSPIDAGVSSAALSVWTQATRISYEVVQEEAQQDIAIFTVIRAYCPLYQESPPESQQDDRLNAALARVTGQLHPRLRNPHAAQVLRQQVAALHTSPQDFLCTTVFPEALLLVARDVATPRRMRVGREWATNTQRKVQEASPLRALPGRAFFRWFISQVYAAATAIVLEEAYPRRTTQSVPLVWCEEEALERLAAAESPGARDSAMLTALLQADETAPADQLHRLLTVASPRACELFRLVSQGLSIKEAAAVLGMSPSTAYVHYHRTSKKVRRR